MFYAIDPANGLAIYEQIVRQVVFAIAAGSMRAGDMVPSVREMARDLAVNPNTVSRAYRQLLDDGVLQSVRGTGLAVTEGARRRCQAERLKLVGQRMRLVLAEAMQSQLTPEEVRNLVEKELAALEKKSSQKPLTISSPRGKEEESS